MVKPVEILIKAKEEASGVFDSLKSKVAAVGVAIAGYFGIRAFGGVINDAADLEAAMSRVQAATDATTEEMVALRKAADDAGANTKYTSVQAAGALENLAKAGLSAKDSIAALPAVLALAQAGDIDLGRSSEYVTKAVMGMGLAFTDAGRVADVLAKGANASNTSVEGLAQALSYAAPVAHSLGLSLETTVAIIGKFADAGIDASRAGTALNSILSQFSDPASKFREELGNAGITTNNFETALRQLAAAGPRGQKAILAVGQEAGPALRALLGQGIGALDDLKKKLDDSAGSAAATGAVMENNLKGSLNGLSSAWDTVKTTLGTPVLPVLRQGVDQLAGALRTAVTDGTIGKFGDAIATAFSSGIKWARDFLSAIDFNKLGADLRAFADRSGEVFKEVGEYATAAGATAQTAYGVMSAGANGVLAVIYKIGEVFADMASEIQGGVANILDGLAKITFGGVSASFKAAADDMRLSAEATLAAGQALGEKSAEALGRMAEGAQTARAGWAALTKAVEDGKPAADASSAAIAQMAAQIEAAGQKTTEAAKATDAARKATDDKRTADTAAAAAVQQLRDEYTQLVAGGSIQAAAEKLQQINKALQGTPPAAKDAAKAAEEAALKVITAYSQLGITSQAELKQLAANAKANFETIKASGTASAMDIQNAFTVMAQKALDAAGPVGSVGRQLAQSALEAQAAANGLAVTFDETGKVIVSAMNAGAAATGNLKTGVDNVNTSLRTQIDLRNKLNTMRTGSVPAAPPPPKTSDGFETNKDGSAKGTFTNNLDVSAAFDLVNKAKANRLTAADLAEAKAAFEQAQGAYDYMEKMGRFNPGGQSHEFVQSTTALYNGARSAYEKVQAMVDAETKAAAKAAAAEAKKAAADQAKKAAADQAKAGAESSARTSELSGQDAETARKSSQSSASTSYTVNITLNGRSSTIKTATAADAADLKDLLQQLADAASRS